MPPFCIDSKDCLWKFVTADELLSLGPCELIAAHLVVSAASTDSYLYDGENTTGKLITALVSQSVTGLSFNPPIPVYCKQGLYVDVGSNVTGIFILWRER